MRQSPSRCSERFCVSSASSSWASVISSARDQHGAEEVALLLRWRSRRRRWPRPRSRPCTSWSLDREMQDAGLLLLGDELEDVGDAEVLERAGQRHGLAPLLRQVTQRGAPGDGEQHQRQRATHSNAPAESPGVRSSPSRLRATAMAKAKTKACSAPRTGTPVKRWPAPDQSRPERVGPAADPRLVVADLHLLVHPGHRRHLAATGVDVDALVAEVATLDQLRVAAAAHRPAALVAALADPLAAPREAEAGEHRHAGQRNQHRGARARDSPPGSGPAARSPGPAAPARRSPGARSARAGGRGR